MIIANLHMVWWGWVFWTICLYVVMGGGFLCIVRFIDWLYEREDRRWRGE